MTKKTFLNPWKKQANYQVGRNTKMPFILTESGFKSSTFDTALLKQGRFIDGLAKGHINGLV
ncbi:MAG: N-acetylmuramoyl-L-alanine amidase [Psychrobacillus psychrotolerans]